MRKPAASAVFNSVLHLNNFIFLPYNGPMSYGILDFLHA